MTPPPEHPGTDHLGTGQVAMPPPECPAHAAVHAAAPASALADLFGPGHEADPKGFYERLRAEHGAVAPVRVAGDLPAWLLLGYRENLEVARTPSRFSRDSRHWGDWREGRVAPDSPLLPVVGWQPMCTFADGAEHERLRTALTESMDRVDRRGMRRHVTRFTNQLVEKFAADGHADLVTEFAEQLPMLVLTQLLGMPDEDGPRLVEASRDLMKGTETAISSNEYVIRTLENLVARKRAEPGQDLASWLLSHPSGLTGEEIVQHLRLVLLTGNETTTNLIANTLLTVLTDPRFRASLAGGQMTLPDAIEHVLWNEPPLAVIPGRWATGDTELAGRQIKAGDMLLLGLAAGNIDPAIRPEIGAPMYGNRSHLAFSGGPHECPGQDIGRAITDTGIDALLLRLPDLRPAVLETELRWTVSWVSRRLVSLPAEFTPRQGDSDTVETETGLLAPDFLARYMALPDRAEPADPADPAELSTTPAPPRAAVAEPGKRRFRARSWWRSLWRGLRPGPPAPPR
ncbi:cytochrome P450 [Streptomyces sp. NPDC059590]|uniref:cytochrome P450 n=1 Tax=Streptomyces sp. NPDC059590 TaxID=3346877 RepID=UPI0036B5B867